MDSSKLFDPWGQLSAMQDWMSTNFPAFKSAMASSPFAYRPVDPIVAEIGILATMHNMASALRDPDKVKAAIAEAIADRARQLAS
jgi:hypothetical protein